MSEGGSILGHIKLGAFRWVIEALTGGTAIAITFKALEVVQAKPEFLPQLLSGGALPLAALVIGMLIFGGRLDRYNANQIRNVVATETLAAGINALVAKDDQKMREQDILLGHLSRTNERILVELREIRLARTAVPVPVHVSREADEKP